jgi:AraC-like DNA-binding protein
MPLQTLPRDASSSLSDYRTTGGGRDLEVSVYETNGPAYQVGFRSARSVTCGVIAGTPLLHLPRSETPSVSLAPGELLVAPPMQPLVFDFPEADRTPVRCLTVEAESKAIGAIVDRMTASGPARPRSFNASAVVHVARTPDLDRGLTGLLSLLQAPPPSLHFLVDLRATELLVRTLATAPRLLQEKPTPPASRRGLGAAVRYARNHLSTPVTVEDLAEAACMSLSTFYRYFRAEFGMTPLEFLTEERIARARSLLDDPDATVADVSAAVGFTSTSHFIRLFKNAEGLTPKQYQLQRRP